MPPRYELGSVSIFYFFYLITVCASLAEMAIISTKTRRPVHA